MTRASNTRSLFPLVGLALAAGAMVATGCVDSGQVFIRHTVLITQAQPPQCVITNTNIIQSSGLLDIGAAGSSYRNLLSVATNLPANLTSTQIQSDRIQSPSTPQYGASEGNVALFNSFEIFFTDADGGPLTGVPGINNPRITQIGGSVQNIQGTLANDTLLSVLSITTEEAAALRQQNPDLAATLENDSNSRSTVIVNIKVNGTTSGASPFATQTFAYPVDLCISCLVGIGGVGGVCPGGQDLVQNLNANTCIPTGQDTPAFDCP